nr:MAG TPA: Putative head tail adaptor [Caudoviricetes sp.]
MELPAIGELNRRIGIYTLTTTPEGSSDMTNTLTLIRSVWAKEEIVGGVSFWGSVQAESTVTHRFVIRYGRGTRPEDLTHAVKVKCEGTEYTVKRLTDMNGAHRFTALECEAQYADD